jgi:hypothetical protein
MADQEANGWKSIIARMRFFARTSDDSHAIETWADELEAVLASPGSETVTPELSAAVRYWETAKLAFDAVRPCFSSNQLRELEAAERRLLAAIHQPASPGSVQWAREQIHQQLRDVRARLTATQEGEDYDRGVCDACNDAIERFNTSASPGSVSDQGKPCATCGGLCWVMRSSFQDLGNGLGSGAAWNEPCPDCRPAPPVSPAQPKDQK